MGRTRETAGVLTDTPSNSPNRISPSIGTYDLEPGEGRSGGHSRTGDDQGLREDPRSGDDQRVGGDSERADRGPVECGAMVGDS